MDAPRGFEPFPFMGIGGIDEKRFEFTHRRKIPHGWDYWHPDNPNQFEREVWLSNAARSISTHQLKTTKKG